MRPVSIGTSVGVMSQKKAESFYQVLFFERHVTPLHNSIRLEIARPARMSKSTPVNLLSVLICLLGQGLLPGEGRPFHQGLLAQNLELLS